MEQKDRLFRSQFILTREQIEPPPQFITHALGAYTLHRDPDLPVAMNECGVLLGHALDWRAPEKGNADILSDLVERGLEHTDHLSGRWAFILRDSLVVGDGGGTLSIVWSDRHVGSSAALLAYCDPTLMLKDRPGIEARRRTGWHSGLAFLATDTEIEGVTALLPNHQLSLESRSASRFYPRVPLAAASVRESAPKIAEVMQGIMRAAANRAPLAIALTSGYDSRLIAAAASNVAADRINFFTIQDEHATPEGHADIVGAGKIAETLGIAHHLTVAPAVSRFRTQSRQSEGIIAERFEGWADVSAQFSDRICISGWGSEVGRNFISWPGSENVNAHDVLACNSLLGFPELVDEAEAWASDARQINQRLGFKTTDLLYWELRLGRWCSAGFNVLSQGNWWMTVYTCRDLFELMIAVPDRQRGNRGARLYPAAIACISRSIADLPFSPVSLRERLYYFRKRDLPHAVGYALHRLGLLNTIRRIKGALRPDPIARAAAPYDDPAKGGRVGDEAGGAIKVRNVA